MGLTGLILSVTLRLIPIETSAMVVDTQRTPALEPLMEMMAEGDDRHRYSVAWVDLMSTGPQFGRGIWLRGDHAEIDLLPRRQRSEPLAYRSPRSVALPVTPPFGLVNRVTARVFNEAWYRKGPGARSGELKSIPSFFHPLDAIRNWNVAYGPAGFVQYQFVVPNGGEQALITAARGIAGSGFPNSLTVLKRMGRDGRGMLSFPMEGWTLAVDLPAVAGVGALLDRLDEHVADAGGRLYLAKDSRMTPEIFRRTYPRLDEFVDLRRRIDPGSVLRSDLSVRLEIP
jgi:decaprenylphospho-beta-D-ribofuranose 2-oxidase